MELSLDIASIITALGGTVALILRTYSVHRANQRADINRRVTDLEDQLVQWAEWAHDARCTAAGHGVRLPAIPRRLLEDDQDTELEAA